MITGSLGMGRSYALTADEIARVINTPIMGNYALGYLDCEGVFIVQYVGRSETNVAAALTSHLGEGYERFKYKHAASPSDAFYTECNNYHDFGGKRKLRNLCHPERPEDTAWKCPRCGIFDL